MTTRDTPNSQLSGQTGEPAQTAEQEQDAAYREQARRTWAVQAKWCLLDRNGYCWEPLPASESFQRQFADNLLQVAQSLTDNGLAGRVEEMQPTDDHWQQALCIMKAALAGDVSQVRDLVHAHLTPQVEAVLSDDLKRKVLRLPPPPAPPLPGWEGTSWLGDTPSLAAFANWLGVMVMICDFSSNQNAVGDGSELRNAYRYIRHLGLADRFPDKPTGAFTTGDTTDILRALKQTCEGLLSTPNYPASETKCELSNDPIPPPAKPPKRKRTRRGHPNPACVSALIAYHGVGRSGDLVTEPIILRELVRSLGISSDTASRFFNIAFNDGEKGGYDKYVRCCESGALADRLRRLEQHYSPEATYGREPPLSPSRRRGKAPGSELDHGEDD